jgi:hypothetical protein
VKLYESHSVFLADLKPKESSVSEGKSWMNERE